MEWSRAIASALFGVKWVRLIDSDGAISVRRVRFLGGKPVAERMGRGIRTVILLDNGKIENGAYVARWEPHDPLEKRRWPRWERP